MGRLVVGACCLMSLVAEFLLLLLTDFGRLALRSHDWLEPDKVLSHLRGLEILVKCTVHYRQQTLLIDHLYYC